MSPHLPLVLLAATLLSSCVNFQDVAFKGIENVHVREMTGDRVALTIDAVVDNPNNYRIKLKNPDVDLWLNGQHLGKAVLDSSVTLDKHTVRTYPVHFSTTTNGALGPILLGGLGSLLSGKAELKASGTVVGQVGLLRKRFPFEVTEEVGLQ
ncbi:MAG: LEA type 2 family protein [Flavobacteriales bacterium]